MRQDEAQQDPCLYRRSLSVYGTRARVVLCLSWTCSDGERYSQTERKWNE